MNFYHHTQTWFNGELFEGKVILISGIIITFISILFWRFGTTPNAKAMVVPLLVVGLLFSLGVGAMMSGYPKRMAAAERAFEQDAARFVLSEKKRVEDFQVLYKYSIGFAAVSFGLTLIAFWGTDNRTFKSICIALSLVAVSLIIIDHFSKERSQKYYIEIQKHLGNHRGDHE